MAQAEEPVATKSGKKSESVTAKNSEPARIPEGRKRVVIEGITPAVDCGRFPAKRTIGDQVRVEADIFTDGHDAIAASLLAHREGFEGWTEIPMHPLVNDRWTASFRVGELGRYGFKVQGWVDHFETWHRDLLKRIKAESDAPVDYLIGADLIAAGRGTRTGRRCGLASRARVSSAHRQGAERPAHSCHRPAVARTGPALPRQAFRHRVRPRIHHRCRSRARAIQLLVRALSPLHFIAEPGQHGTFADCEKRLPYIAEMGFNVVYLPPIHPIGHTFRKGRNN